ncbi:unnamed protein product [Laminaria digitata]
MARASSKKDNYCRICTLSKHDLYLCSVFVFGLFGRVTILLSCYQVVWSANVSCNPSPYRSNLLCCRQGRPCIIIEYTSTPSIPHPVSPRFSGDPRSPWEQTGRRILY